MEKHWSADLIKNKYIIILLFLIFMLLCVVVSVGLFTDRHIKLFGIEFNSEKEYPTAKTESTNKEKDKNIFTKKDTITNDKKSVNSFQQTKSKFSIKSSNKQNIDSVKAQSIVNISSNHQTGGITAQNVTIGVKPEQRRLDFALKKQLFEFLSNKDEKIQITSVIGDNEAYKFSIEIEEFLKRNGYSNIETSQGIFSPPIIGQAIHRNMNNVSISIGSHE